MDIPSVKGADGHSLCARGYFLNEGLNKVRREQWPTWYRTGRLECRRSPSKMGFSSVSVFSLFVCPCVLDQFSLFLRPVQDILGTTRAYLYRYRQFLPVRYRYVQQTALL